MTLRCCRRSRTDSNPAHRASALLPVPARPPKDTMPTSGSMSRSRAIRCSALRPLMPKASRSPRTRRTRLSAVTRANPLPRSDNRTRPQWQGRSRASSRSITPSSNSRSRSVPATSISCVPVYPDSIANSARYSSAASPTDDALTRIGKSLLTSTTSAPSLAKFRATAKIRVSLSPSRRPEGRDSTSVWFNSTRTVPPDSPTGNGSSSRPCFIRSSSISRNACRAK